MRHLSGTSVLPVHHPWLRLQNFMVEDDGCSKKETGVEHDFCKVSSYVKLPYD